MRAEWSSTVLETDTLFVFISMNESQANILLFPIKWNMDLKPLLSQGDT